MDYIVYFLQHHHMITKTNIDIKDLGIYDCKENAEKAIAKLTELPGFKNTGKDFKVIKFILNKTRWINGFDKFIGSEIPKSDKVKNNAIDVKNLGLTHIYLLSHFFEIEENEFYKDEVRYIGIYSTEEKMINELQKMKTKNGFKDYVDFFADAQYEINKMEWTSGFSTVY